VTAIHHSITAILALSVLAFSAPASAAEPEYSFKLTKDRQADLCAHMKIVFDKDFQHMWSDPILTQPPETIFSGESAFAFSLLPAVQHDWRMTMAMRYSKVPSSREFDEIPWHEGHAVFGGDATDPSSLAMTSLQPYLIAHLDIDNDGTDDTLIKIAFTRGYSWLFSQGEAAGSGDMLLIYHNIKIDEGAPTTISEMINGTEKYGKPSVINASLVRPFIYSGKPYFATYAQGFGEPKTKQSLNNLKKDVPPHEQMLLSSLTYVDRLDRLGRPEWTWNVLCQFDMNQSR
jgi:hypothetical protein